MGLQWGQGQVVRTLHVGLVQGQALGKTLGKRNGLILVVGQGQVERTLHVGPVQGQALQAGAGARDGLGGALGKRAGLRGALGKRNGLPLAAEAVLELAVGWSELVSQLELLELAVRWSELLSQVERQAAEAVAAGVEAAGVVAPHSPSSRVLWGWPWG